MGIFVGDIDLRVIPRDPKNFLVPHEFDYICNNGEIIHVKEGLITDLASTPRIVWALYPPFGLYTGAAIVHDELYTKQPWGTSDAARKKSDLILLEAMETEGVFVVSRNIIYSQVRMWGWSAWKEHTKHNQLELLKAA